MTDEQLTLFAEEQRPHKASKSFLAQNAQSFDALITSTTLRAQADAAATYAHDKAGAGRNSAALFEDRFKELLLTPDIAAAVVAETLAAAAAAGLDLRQMEITSGKGTALADILIRLQIGDARSVVIATNIKRLRPGRHETEGGSIPQLLQLALDEVYDPAKPPSPKGFDWEQAIVEWYGRRRKIQDGRDYWLLVCRVSTDGVCAGVEAWGALSGMRRNQVVVARHPSRAVTSIAEPTAVLGADVDINHALASTLLPPPSASALRALLVSIAELRGGPDAALPLASRLLDLDDQVLFSEVFDAFHRAAEPPAA